jgi:lysophospholipase L1-like esterase
VTAWYFLDGVDVVNAAINGAVVAFGASTSDGVGSTFGANERYSDDLASRLLGLPAGPRLSVLNAGIPGNQLLITAPRAGQSGLSRFYRDALAQSDVRVIIVWEGTNDISRPDYLAIADAFSPWALAGLAVVGPVDRASLLLPERRSLGRAEQRVIAL